MEQKEEIIVNYEKIDKKVNKLIKLASLYLKEDKEFIKNEIQKAYLYAREAHHGQMRLSGEPYIDHPVEASLLLLALKPDLCTIQSCLLHDVIEDTPKTYEDILTNFGNEVANICAGMEKLSKIRYTGEERTIASLRKMFVAMSNDLRIIFVKLSDRLHNMKTLSFHPKKEKRERIALETINIYSPIADRLGLYHFKNMIDEECFKILNPTEYRNIKRQLSKLNEIMISFKKNSKQEIDNLLSNTGLKYDVKFRVKSIYSIFKKMKRKKVTDIKELYDIFGVKILVEDISSCYKVLGIIHSACTPIPKRFKDYIALPKPNGYKSLHTTVLGFLKNYRQEPTEIQIKTFEMDLTSEIGIRAHFEYKEKGSKIAKDLDWVKELRDLTEKLENNDFIDSLKIDIFKDRIFVLTPKGKPINLPAGSTAIDFAYRIHTDLGNKISLAKVNGKIIPLDKELKNGDVVEIIIDNNKKPNPFYIGIVKTTKAKNAIRSFMKNEDKLLHIERGKNIINNLLEKYQIEKLDKDLSILKSFDDRTYNYEERLDILEKVGNLSLSPSALIKKIFKAQKIHIKNENKDKNENENKDKDKDKDKNENKDVKNIIIGGEKNIPYKIGTCCQDKLTNKIVAYINRKGIITIHNRDCLTLSRLNKDRFLSAYFEGDENHNIIFDVNFILLNKIGVLKNISDILYDMNINILEIISKKHSLNETSLSLKLEIIDHDYLIIDRFLDRIKLILGKHLISYKIEKIE